ncbi:MAG: peptidoglycan editing factor PgeF [Holosporales bacterium]|jgi:YfiH family protein|nr:peptidoglycan editing factor PgeF [Holosporales bacterium]
MNIIKTDLLSKIAFIDHGFFNRKGGQSSGAFESLNVGFDKGDDDKNVKKNREIIAANFNIPVSNLITLNQVHGDTVHVIDSENINKYKFSSSKQALSNSGDAIITDQNNLLIGVVTADCAPILLCDEYAKIIAVIHAGWRGALGNIIENTIKELESKKCKHIVASIGPCIQKKSFFIENAMSDKIEKKYISYFYGKVFFDMQLLILEKLMQLGVKTVSKINIDTFSNNDFFSCRRQNGKYGVQFSGIIIKE